jgi:hypothetical protein
MYMVTLQVTGEKHGRLNSQHELYKKNGGRQQGGWQANCFSCLLWLRRRHCPGNNLSFPGGERLFDVNCSGTILSAKAPRSKGHCLDKHAELPAEEV